LKIRLDECIPNRVALAVVQVVGNRAGYEVSFVRHGGPDPIWLETFAKDGGTAIVSGDYDILQHWPNLIAYTESGLISFFPPKRTIIKKRREDAEALVAGMEFINGTRLREAKAKLRRLKC
jgi:PIN like domain